MENVPIWISGDLFCVILTWNHDYFLAHDVLRITSLIVAEICGGIWNSALVPILMLLSVRQFID